VARDILLAEYDAAFVDMQRIHAESNAALVALRAKYGLKQIGQLVFSIK